jgi:methylmalonyl-CoA carboxyltransferase large subunit
MNSPSVNSAALTEAVEALRQEVARLGERVAALENCSATVPPVAAPAAALTPAAPPAGVEGLSEEILLVISAAVAAYLGHKPRIRQIRLVGQPAWAQQGRVSIQASHAVPVRHTRTAP